MKRNVLKYLLTVLLSLLGIGGTIYIMIRDFHLSLPPLETGIKIGVVMVLWLTSVLFLLTDFRRYPLHVYEQAYTDYIRNAFSDRVRLRRKLLRAVRLYDRGMYQKSLRLLHSFLRLPCSDAECCVIWLFAAMNYDSMYDSEKAIELYNKLLAYEPNNIYANNNIAIAYMATEEYENAIQHLRKAISLDPTQAVLYSNLADCYLNCYEIDEALRYAELSMDLDPTQCEAPALLAVIHAILEDDEAQEHFETAVSAGFDPSDLTQLIQRYTGEEITE